MAPQHPIPCILMRAGTSKGLFLRLADLPAEAGARARVLLAAMGSPDRRQVDGIGGADTLTSKVAMIAVSAREGVDVDYHFAQVAVERAFVDTAPSCGNMLAAVGPFAIEAGLVAVQGPQTRVVIHDINTGSRIEAVIQTPGGAVDYDGEARIAGVPGAAAPVRLNFLGIAGSKTGALFPTGRAREEIDGIPVTLIDAAVPMMILRAADLGRTGAESPADLDADHAFLARIEAMRRQAGRRMGLGDVAGKVIPKLAMLAPPRAGGAVMARYFVPDRAHVAYAVTGGLCTAACVMAPGTVAEGVARRPPGDEAMIVIEHPGGSLGLAMTTRRTGAGIEVVSGGVIRTARKLMAGEVFVPAAIWGDG